MTRRSSVIIVVLVALAAALGIAWQAWKGPETAASPPIGGAMKDFTVSRDRPPAPGTAFVAADGKPHGFAEYKGRLVLVNFWATWCAPCIKEMPSLDRLGKRIGTDGGMALLALSQDLKGWPVIAPFLDKLRLESLPVYFDPEGAVARGLGVTVLPTTVLIGRDGRLLGQLVGPAEWDSDDAARLIDYFLQRATP